MTRVAEDLFRLLNAVRAPTTRRIATLAATIARYEGWIAELLEVVVVVDDAVASERTVTVSALGFDTKNSFFAGS